MKTILTLCFLSCTALQARGAEQRPNIVVIFADDQGWADLGSQGVRTDIRTPNLDALAAGGLRATNGYVTAPQCVPSRAGLMSGRYQQRFGVERNQHALDGFDQQQTIASRLKKAGYVTGMTGKWHLGPVDKIIEHGFDDVFCTQVSNGMNFKAWANFDLDGKTTPGGYVTRGDLYHLDANADAACAFIDRHQEQPFFFYLAYRAPHVPLDAPEKYTARFPGQMPERRRQCLAMMSAVDDGVGRIMQTLRDHRLEEKTLIFYMADNGAPLDLVMQDTMPITVNGWDGSINSPLNGEKGMLTEGGIREPWLAYWKGTIPPGQVFQHPVISLDVAATAVALAGLPADPPLDGVNLLPFFQGENQGAPHDRLYWRWISQAAIREGKWKLLVGGSRSYLFDLDTDPGEKHNLVPKHPEIAKSLRAKLEHWTGELEPPGIAIQPMIATWEQHFDYFLEGKSITEIEASRTKAADWVVRNAKAEVKNGVLRVVPQESGHSAFVAFTGLKIAGPVLATATIRNEQGGQIGIAWRLDEQKDFTRDQTVRQDFRGSSEFQTVTVEVPAKGDVVHVRLLLPPENCDLRDFEIKTIDSRAEAKTWSFR